MKLILASTVIPKSKSKSLEAFVGKPCNDITFGLIENAADPYNEVEKEFVYKTRKHFQNLGLQVRIINLTPETTYNDIKNTVLNVDILWFGGGNTYYLRHILQKSGLDKKLPQVTQNGLIIGGASAGAIVLCPSLRYYDLVDAPIFSPEYIDTGLGIINEQVIPHWNHPELQSDLQIIAKKYKSEGARIRYLEDGDVYFLHTSH